MHAPMQGLRHEVMEDNEAEGCGDQSACWELGCAAYAHCISWEAGREAREEDEEQEQEGGVGAARADPVEKTLQEEEEDTQQAAREQY